MIFYPGMRIFKRLSERAVDRGILIAYEVMIEEIHELNKTIAAKDAQITALTEQVAKLTA